MKSLKILIKINKLALDEKRQELVQLEEQKTQLLQWQKTMKDELEKEFQFVASNPEMSGTFDSYRKKITQRQLNMDIALKDINLQIELKLQQIAYLFGEVKKYEIIQQQHLAKAIKEQKYKETKSLDEIALNNYLKRQAE
jgi:hypothetical protein